MTTDQKFQFDLNVHLFQMNTYEEKIWITKDSFGDEHLHKGSLATEDCNKLIGAASTLKQQVDNNAITPVQGNILLNALQKERDTLIKLNKRDKDKYGNFSKFSEENVNETKQINNNIDDIVSNNQKDYDVIEQQNKAHQQSESEIQALRSKVDAFKSRIDADDNAGNPEATINRKDGDLLRNTASHIEREVELGYMAPTEGNRLLDTVEQHYNTLSGMNSAIPTPDDKVHGEQKKTIHSEMEAIQNSLKSRKPYFTKEEQTLAEVAEHTKTIGAEPGKNPCYPGAICYGPSDPVPTHRGFSGSFGNGVSGSFSRDDNSIMAILKQILNFFLQLLGFPPLDSQRNNNANHPGVLGNGLSEQDIRDQIRSPQNQAALVDGFHAFPFATALTSFALSTEFGRNIITNALNRFDPEAREALGNMLSNPKMANFLESNQENLQRIGLTIPNQANQNQLDQSLVETSAPKSTSPNTTSTPSSMSVAPDTQKISTFEDKIEAAALTAINQINAKALPSHPNEPTINTTPTTSFSNR